MYVFFLSRFLCMHGCVHAWVCVCHQPKAGSFFLWLKKFKFFISAQKCVWCITVDIILSNFMKFEISGREFSTGWAVEIHLAHNKNNFPSCQKALQCNLTILTWFWDWNLHLQGDSNPRRLGSFGFHGYHTYTFVLLINHVSGIPHIW